MFIIWSLRLVPRHKFMLALCAVARQMERVLQLGPETDRIEREQKCFSEKGRNIRRRYLCSTIGLVSASYHILTRPKRLRSMICAAPRSISSSALQQRLGCLTVPSRVTI